MCLNFAPLVNDIMPLQLDRGGLPLNCSSERALELFNKALHASLSTNESSLQYLREACELDSGFVLVHCMLVRIHEKMTKTTQNIRSILYYCGYCV